MDNNQYKYLAWFLGPKAENADVMEAMCLQILRDYFHWRKNYFPGDPILINKALQREFEDEHDLINQRIHELMADLRRNFPFYSPRYVAHELSDTLMSSVLGYIAGMLFNPNNVTPEAAPVTTELEIDACNAILEMLGFNTPPPPPLEEKPRDYYERMANKEFGWAHITSGGTVANIEALWVARQVRYFPLAVQQVAKAKGLEIFVKLPNADPKGPGTDIRLIDEYQLLLLKPNESIYLLSKYVNQIRNKEYLLQEQADKIGALAWDYLNETKYALARGTGNLFSKFPPVILVAGSRHYSITKAADIIGVGQKNVISVKTDAKFRMDVQDLKKCIETLLRKKQVPLCVIATVGTTEEGAVDPVHEILDLRTELEKKHNASFWLHIDAAWGGFIRSLFCLDLKDKEDAVTSKVSRLLNFEHTDDLPSWHTLFSEKIMGLADSLEKEEDITAQNNQVDTVTPDDGDLHVQPTDVINDMPDTKDVATVQSIVSGVSEAENRVRKSLEIHLQKMAAFIKTGKSEQYISYLERFPKYFGKQATTLKLPETFGLTLYDLNNLIQRFVKDEIDIRAGSYRKQLTINWPYGNLCSAFMAFPKAESITIDPHKMGYSLYPCGCIAFKNDRVRLFVLQKAPYITATTQNALLHMPPRHAEITNDEDGERRIVIDSFSPFILEGSKPGASAAALWLSIKTVPLTMRKHGMIVRGSILAARELYEWLTKWNEAMDTQRSGLDYRFISLTPEPPDTNLVTFVVKKKTSNRLADMNKLTKLVYEKFTIQSELGEREYSYSQPFFLSNTKMDSSHYPTKGLEAFFNRCGFSFDAKVEYEKSGLVVLRATVMNPYLNASRYLYNHDYARIFTEELARSAKEHVRNI